MQLVDEVRIIRELELPDAMRLQSVRPPDALHRACADAGRLRHHRRGPVRGLGWGIGLGESHHACRNFRSERRNARRACLVAQQALEALPREAFLPAPDAGLGLAGPALDLVGADPVRTQQYDLGSPNLLLRRIAIPYERFQTQTIGGCNNNGNTGAHAPKSHAIDVNGIPSGIQMSDLIH